MLARSTACRHGVGRSSVNATSIRSSRPSRTSRLAGLMSRWARPVPQLADDAEAVVDHLGVDLGLAQFGGAVEELGDQQILPFRGELDHAVGSRPGRPAR